MARYIVKTAAACMPVNCWGTYRRVAILEVEEGVEDVAMISERAIGCVRVVETWEKLNVGTTDRCAYATALAEAEAECDRLNCVAAYEAVKAGKHPGVRVAA